MLMYSLKTPNFSKIGKERYQTYGKVCILTKYEQFQDPNIQISNLKSFEFSFKTKNFKFQIFLQEQINQVWTVFFIFPPFQMSFPLFPPFYIFILFYSFIKKILNLIGHGRFITTYINVFLLLIKKVFCTIAVFYVYWIPLKTCAA